MATRRPLPVKGTAVPDGHARLRGAVHVHSSLSDGASSPQEVARAAKAAGLDFVVLTDHNNLDAKPLEGYHDGVLVVVGTEISTTAGHVVAVGLREDPAFRFPSDPGAAMDDVALLGGASFVAHPSSPRADFRWTAWDLPGPWGIELLNGDTAWRAAGWGRLLKTAALYGLNRRHALLASLRPPYAALAEWDRLLARRPTPALAGADAHGQLPLARRWSVPFPSYESVLPLLVNHVLVESRPSGRAAADAVLVTRALARGRSYVGLDALAPAGGFFFVAEGDGPRATMGDTIAPSPDLRLRAGGAMPTGTRVRLLRDGRPVAEGDHGVELATPAPGVYRVEARVAGWEVPWVLSNPIYVFDAAEAAEREHRARPPSPPEPPAVSRTLADFDGPTDFHPEHDPTSSLSADMSAGGEGPDHSAAARLEFRLAAPSAGQPHTFCALVSRQPRDLSGGQGLVFHLKADSTYRLRVEVRDANPASTDEGTEWWFTSVRTSPAWRRVTVPFTTLRSLNPRTDGRLDLAAVRQLVFVLDRDEVKPGTAGTLWLDDVAVY